MTPSLRSLMFVALWACNGADKDTGAEPADEADADTDADSDADTDADSDADSDADTDADTDADSDADTDADVSVVSIDVDNFYPEGVAIDQATRTLYVGSFATGSIYQADLASGAVAPLLGEFGAGGSIAGMKVSGGALWACVSPQDASTAAASVVRVDLATGSILDTYEMGLFNFCNDLAVSQAGDLYVTDSYQSLVYRLPAGGTELEVWFSDPTYAPAPGSFGFNGVTLGADQASLLVGRFDTGELLSIAIEAGGAAGAVTPQPIDTAISYGGIDGLDWVDGELYAVRDYQLVRLSLGGGVWASSMVDASLDSPTTFAADTDGSLWLVESQFSKLFDGDPSTNGVAPYRVVRVQP